MFGLSLPGMKRAGTTTFLENILRLKPFNKMVMAFYFSNARTGGKNLFMLGGFSSSYYTGPLLYYPVDDVSYWKLFISQIRVGPTPLEFCAAGCYAFLDTGTSYLSFPKAAVGSVKKVLGDVFKANFARKASIPKLMYSLEQW